MTVARRADERSSRRRSQEWFGADGRSGMIYRSWMRNQGFGPEVFDGRPVIGIANTWSELTPCNAHLRPARGRGQARRLAGRRVPAGVPGHGAGRDADAADRDAVPQPAGAWTSRSSCAPTRSTASCCCPAATRPRPALLMGAASVDLPALMVTGGPMLNGKFRGQRHRLRHRTSGGSRQRPQRRADDRRRTAASPRAACPAATATA